MFSLATLVATEPRMLNWTLVSTLMLQFAVYRDRRPLPPKPAFLSSIEVEATIQGEPLCDTPIFCPRFFSSENAPIVFFSPNLLVNENTFLKGFSSCPVETHLWLTPQILGRRESHREDTFSATILGGPGGLVVVGCSKTQGRLGKFEATKTYYEMIRYKFLGLFVDKQVG